MTTFPVQESIDRLDALFGIRDPVDRESLFKLHTRGQIGALVAAIASELTLPVEVQLTVTSERTRFQSHHLARTNSRGRGVEGIEAQVIIPSNLPLFGSAALRSYPITVLINPTFREADPATGVTILAHELSHVLLHSLRHPERDSEVFTDLLPLVFGFGEIVFHGRKVSTESREGGVVHTTTATFGYLSDADFAVAFGRVESLLAERHDKARRLRATIAALEVATNRVAAALTDFSELRRRLDSRAGRVRGHDAVRLVAIHASDYSGEIERAIRQARDVAINAESFLGTTRYPKEAVAALDAHSRLCASAASRLDRAFLTLRDDIILVARHCGVSHRLIAALKLKGIVGPWMRRSR